MRTAPRKDASKILDKYLKNSIMTHLPRGKRESVLQLFFNDSQSVHLHEVACHKRNRLKYYCDQVEEMQDLLLAKKVAPKLQQAIMRRAT